MIDNGRFGATGSESTNDPDEHPHAGHITGTNSHARGCVQTAGRGRSNACRLEITTPRPCIRESWPQGDLSSERLGILDGASKTTWDYESRTNDGSIDSA